MQASGPAQVPRANKPPVRDQPRQRGPIPQNVATFLPQTAPAPHHHPDVEVWEGPLQLSPAPWSRRQSEGPQSTSLMEAAVQAGRASLAREAARLQQKAKLSLQLTQPTHTNTLTTLLGQLEQVQEELVVHDLVLQSMHDDPDTAVGLHDPSLEQKAAEVVKQRKAHAGLQGLLVPEAAGGVVSESLDETAAEALHFQLEREVACMSAQYTTLLGDILVMKANPEYHFNLQAGKWHTLLQATKRADDLGFQLLLRQLLLRNLEERPHTCLLSIHDPVLEHEAARIIKQRKQLEKQLNRAISGAKYGYNPAALMLMMVALGSM